MLDSIGVLDVEYFTIDGDHFLTVANHYNGWSYKQDSVVYRWEAGIFKEFQRIPTKGVRNAHYFTINTRKFMLFTNNMYGSNEVSIYEWKNKKFGNKIQDIQITYPQNRCSTFTIYKMSYIACGMRSVSADAVTVRKWSGKQFESFQALHSSYVRGRPHIIHSNSSVYLAIAKFRNYGNNLDIDSFIYRWNGSKFVQHRSIPTHGARGWDSFTAAAGEVFLVVAISYTPSGARYNVPSAVYKMADNMFDLYQKLPTTWTEYVHAFTHKGKNYPAVVNYSDRNRKNLNSQVYVWN